MSHLALIGFYFFISLTTMGSGINFTLEDKSSKLKDLENLIRNDEFGKINGITVLNRQGKLVYEQYFGFAGKYNLNPISSVTKSITSIAIGICIDRGLIKSIDEPIFQYFPEYKNIFIENPVKKRITIRHLLNQTTGLKWDEWDFPYNFASNSLMALLESGKNWVNHFFYLPVDTIPGLKFCYNSLSSQVLAEIVSRTCGMDFRTFVAEKFFKPLGITNYQWDEYPNNSYPAWGGILLTTTDMAKIGLLVLNGGVYKNRQVVSANWIQQSTSIETVFNGNINYGLHWWIEHSDEGGLIIYAAGYGDQYVFVFPEKEIVIAINSQNFSDYRWPRPVIDIAKIIANG